MDTGTQVDNNLYEVERSLGKKTINGKLHCKCKWSADVVVVDHDKDGDVERLLAT
jgi:hypothetical protein